MSLNTAHLPGESNWQINSHWISVQDNTTKYLVQGGWNINEQEATYYYGFFYEFVGPGGTGVRPITLDSSNWHPGDQFYFSLWYHSTDSWGFQIKDVSTNTILWSHYIYPNGGYAAAYIGHTANVATENNCFYDLFDDGVITIKQPSLHVMGGAWYLFENVVQVGGFQNKADLVVAGHTLETGSLTDANGYAYHTWKNFY